MSGIGEANYQKHQEGKTLYRNQAIQAKCFECMGDYLDGRYDCLVKTCPLYPFMPYRGKKKK